MRAVIGRYYANYKDARNWADKQELMWRKRIKFWVVSYDRGHLVIGESQIRKTFPELFPKRKYGGRNEYKNIK